MRAVAAFALLPGIACVRRAPLPPSAPSVRLTMREYGFEGVPATLEAGPVVFRAHNRGRLSHEIVLVPLPRGLPGGLAQAVRSKTHRAATVIALLAPRPPGSGITFASHLSRGRYGLVCFVRDPDSESHAVKGMTAEFEVMERLR